MAEPGSYSTDTSDMFAVHHALRGAFDSAPAYVGSAGLDGERVGAVGSFYENVIEFLHVHHESEDEILYPLLVSRCGDQHPEITRIDDQHKVLNDPMDAGRAALAAWRSAPSADDARTVVEALGAINDALAPDLADEEATVVPLCTRWLSPEEWAQLPEHSIASFKGDKPWLTIGLVSEQLTDEARERVFAGMPPEVRTLVVEQWMPMFESFIAEVRR